MKKSDLTKSQKNIRIAITAFAVVLFALVIVAISIFAYKAFLRDNSNITYPSPIIGADATADAYSNAAKIGKTRTVSIQGRWDGVIDNSRYWTGFFVSADGLIVTSYSTSRKSVGFVETDFNDYVITVLNNTGESETYYATTTSYFDSISDIRILKIKDKPVSKTFDYFEIAQSATVKFSSTAIIMSNAINLGVMAHSASVGNPSALYKDSAGLNDYMSTAVMLINGAINTGSKGAPLIDKNGKIIGMILSKYLISPSSRPNDTVMSMGFATKSDNIIALISKIGVTL